MTERWETVEAINAARAAMEARLGWEQPVAWGLLTRTVPWCVRTCAAATFRPSRWRRWWGIAAAAARIRCTAIGDRGGARPGRAGRGVHGDLAPEPRRAAHVDGGDAVVAYVAEADFVAEVEDRYAAALLAEIRRGRQ